MRYASIRSMDISNGEGIGVSLFVQGCRFRCPNCFNKDTWDFNGGKEWTPEVEDKFIGLASKPYIKRISILGGEPLADENLDGVLNLINKIRLSFGNTKTIWLYTGYEIDIYEQYNCDHTIIETYPRNKNHENDFKRVDIIKQCDVLVDGKYIDSQKDIVLRWKGSSNQRVINIQESLRQRQVILWCD